MKTRSDCSPSVDAHVKVLREGLASADLILTTGGTSMGASDLLKVR